MHTLAAESQSLHTHSFAYVKQNPQTAKIQKLIHVINALVLALLATACVTLPRKTSEARSNPEPAKIRSTTLININTAPSEELEKLPGIGEAIAERIVEHRQKFGDFRRAEHLMMVHGISDQKFRAIRELIVVD